MISYSDFVRLLHDVSECNSPEEYIAEVGGTVPIGDPCKIIELLGIMWEMAHDGLTIRSIATACKTSMRQIGIKLGISRRTIGNWSEGVASPPEWQLPLIAYAAVSDYQRQKGSKIMKYWYAVMMDREDTDWGTGSFDLEEAKAMAAKYPEGYIAVIDASYDENGNATTDGICVDEIMLDD